MITKIGPALLRRPIYKASKMRNCGEWSTYDVEVRVMAIAEGWAMVRRKRAIPVAVRLSDLYPITN